jgi:hypothetical protein
VRRIGEERLLQPEKGDIVERQPSSVLVKVGMQQNPFDGALLGTMLRFLEILFADKNRRKKRRF